VEAVDREGLRRRVKDPFYQNTISILAMENDQVLGRIEYHFYGCMQDGYRMAFMCCRKPDIKALRRGCFRRWKKTAGNMGLTNII